MESGGGRGGENPVYYTMFGVLFICNHMRVDASIFGFFVSQLCKCLFSLRRSVSSTRFVSACVRVSRVCPGVGVIFRACVSRCVFV